MDTCPCRATNPPITDQRFSASLAVPCGRPGQYENLPGSAARAASRQMVRAPTTLTPSFLSLTNLRVGPPVRTLRLSWARLAVLSWRQTRLSVRHSRRSGPSSTSPIGTARSGFGGPSPPSFQHVELWAHGLGENHPTTKIISDRRISIEIKVTNSIVTLITKLFVLKGY